MGDVTCAEMNYPKLQPMLFILAKKVKFLSENCYLKQGCSLNFLASYLLLSLVRSPCELHI